MGPELRKQVPRATSTAANAELSWRCPRGSLARARATSSSSVGASLPVIIRPGAKQVLFVWLETVVRATALLAKSAGARTARERSLSRGVGSGGPPEHSKRAGRRVSRYHFIKVGGWGRSSLGSMLSVPLKPNLTPAPQAVAGSTSIH